MTYLRKGAPRIGTVQNLAVTSATSTATLALNSQTGIIRVAVTQDTYLNIGSPGADSTATTASVLLTAGTTEYYAVEGLEKVAGRAASTSGLMSVMELPNS
jgi:hypothetical protein